MEKARIIQMMNLDILLSIALFISNFLLAIIFTKIVIQSKNIKEMSSKLEKISENIHDLKERIAFLEAGAIYTMPLEDPKPNNRSLAAKERWKRRKQKTITEQES